MEVCFGLRVLGDDRFHKLSRLMGGGGRGGHVTRNKMSSTYLRATFNQLRWNEDKGWIIIG